MNQPSGSSSAYKRLAECLWTAREIVFFTGAGLSAESGLPTFRDGDKGYWNHLNPEETASLQAFQSDPERVMAWYAERKRIVDNARPNASHQAIAQLENHFADKRISVVTQNVDGYHGAVGSRRIVELHGTIHRLRCHARCGYVRPWVLPSLAEAACPGCGAAVRPDLVWFGETLDSGVFSLAEDAALHADVFIAVGTSAVVQPATRLLTMAKKVGALLVEINPNTSPLSLQADLSIRNTADEFFRHLSAALGLPVASSDTSVCFERPLINTGEELFHS